jgi:hypothetical protein
METTTGRLVIRATAPYLWFAAGTDALDIDVTVDAAGHNTTQARCALSDDGTEVLTAHAALGRRDLDVEGL